MICDRYHTLAVNILAFAMLVLFARPSMAECLSDANAMYDAFKMYRQQLNTAKHIDELKPYFSDNFNQYYGRHLENRHRQPGYNRFLTQYWDNLNTARDIVIVFDFWARCINNTPALHLVAVLDNTAVNKADNGAANGDVKLWQVTVYFMYEHNNWKIDSFEYRKLQRRTSKSSRQYTAPDIIDNFVNIR